jgi:hypothetical protein
MAQHFLLSAAARSFSPGVMLPLMTGPLIVADQDVTRASSFGTSREFRNLLARAAIKAGFRLRTLLQG